MGQGSSRIQDFLFSLTVVISIGLCAGCGGTGSSVSSQLAGGGTIPPQSLPPTPPTPPPVPPPTPSSAPTISLSASAGTVVAGQLVTLSWTTTNAASISFSP